MRLFLSGGNRDGEIRIFYGFYVGVDSAVEHVNNTGGVFSEGRVVSNHDDSVAFGVDTL